MIRHLAADPHARAQCQLGLPTPWTGELNPNTAALILKVEPLAIVPRAVTLAGHRGDPLDGDAFPDQRARSTDGGNSTLDPGTHRRAANGLGPVANAHAIVLGNQHGLGRRRLDGHASRDRRPTGHLCQYPPHLAAVDYAAIRDGGDGQARRNVEGDQHALGADTGLVGHCHSVFELRAWLDAGGSDEGDGKLPRVGKRRRRGFRGRDRLWRAGRQNEQQGCQDGQKGENPQQVSRAHCLCPRTLAPHALIMEQITALGKLALVHQ